MSVSKLKSGRYRAQVFDAEKGCNVSAGLVLGTPKISFATRREAKRAELDAYTVLHERRERGVTVGEFYKRWTTDPLFARAKESTNIHNAERIKAFAEAFKDRPIHEIGDREVSRWLGGGSRASQVPALRAMFNDAASPLAGRIVKNNPFAGLRLERRSRRFEQPPDEKMAEALCVAADALNWAGWSGWLRCAMWTGLRPGELDALRWDDVDLDRSVLNVERQWNAKVRCFTAPKNGKGRPVVVTPQALGAILTQPRPTDEIPREERWVFTNLHGEHWRPSGRAYWWKATRAAAGFDGSLYLATRHFFGWYATNRLLLPPEDVAFALGHEDGGALVRSTYGHRDRDEGLARVASAFGGQR